MPEAPSAVPPPEITVAVVEDHRSYREYLVALLGGSDGFRCTGSYSSMEDALLKLSYEPPQVVMLDIGLPGMDGVEGVRRLKERFPATLVLMQTVYEDDERIFGALCGGASGYLLKKTPPARILEGLKEAIAGGAPMSPEIARRVIALFRDFSPPERADYHLTPHEVRILKLLVEGHNYKTAAEELGVMTSTVDYHLQKIYGKLHVHSKSEAVAKALRNRLV